MICPKCGYDCGNAKFCPECGEKLLGKTVNDSNAQVWSVGMPCPHCGGTKLDGNCCAFCGVQLIAEVRNKSPKKMAWGNIPLGAHQVVDGYLKLKEDVLVMKNTYTRECVIPYETIVGVEYTEPRALLFGYLTIRWKENAHRPFPANYSEAMYDETTVRHKVGDDVLFFQIYHAIKDYISTQIRPGIKNLPLGVYQAYKGYLKLSENELALKNGDHDERIIPYKEIVGVEYKAPGLLRFGYLSIRWKDNSHIPFPTAYWKALEDDTTVFYFNENKERFFQIYHAIKDYLDNQN